MIKILYEDRKIIEEMYNSQMPINRIADRINVARSTLYRESVSYTHLPFFEFRKMEMPSIINHLLLQVAATNS